MYLSQSSASTTPPQDKGLVQHSPPLSPPGAGLLRPALANALLPPPGPLSVLTSMIPGLSLVTLVVHLLLILFLCMIKLLEIHTYRSKKSVLSQ